MDEWHFFSLQPWGILFVCRYCQTSLWEKQSVDKWRWHVHTLAGYQRFVLWCIVTGVPRESQACLHHDTNRLACGGRCVQPGVKHNARRRPHAELKLEVEDTTLTHRTRAWATAQNTPPSYFKQSVNRWIPASSAVDEWWETALLRKLIFFLITAPYCCPEVTQLSPHQAEESDRHVFKGVNLAPQIYTHAWAGEGTTTLTQHPTANSEQKKISHLMRQTATAWKILNTQTQACGDDVPESGITLRVCEEPQTASLARSLDVLPSHKRCPVVYDLKWFVTSSREAPNQQAPPFYFAPAGKAWHFALTDPPWSQRAGRQAQLRIADGKPAAAAAAAAVVAVAAAAAASAEAKMLVQGQAGTVGKNRHTEDDGSESGRLWRGREGKWAAGWSGSGGRLGRTQTDTHACPLGGWCAAATNQRQDESDCSAKLSWVVWFISAVPLSIS